MENNPIVTIEMEDGGIIKAELYPDIAPQSVYNFISLANSGYYDGLIFHRVINGFMIQGGDPNGRLPAGQRHRRPRLLHQGRVQVQRIQQRPAAHPRRAEHGPYHDPRQRRQPVLHHA